MISLTHLALAAPLLVSTALAAAHYPPIAEDKSTPTQQRLSIYSRGAVSVAWNTYQETANPCVAYGLSQDNLNLTSCSEQSVTYPTSRTWANTVVLRDLKPSTQYFYKIQSTNSSIEYFQSARDAGDKTPFAFNSIADLGVYGEDGFTIKGDQSRKREIPQVQPALNHTTIGSLAKTIDSYEVLFAQGDTAYADDFILRSHNVLDGANAYQAILEQYWIQMAPVLGRKLYMVGPGNHEANCQEFGLPTVTCPTGQKNFTDFAVRFGQTHPTAFDSASSDNAAKTAANKAKALAQPPFWYSFDYGMVHFVMFDTETDFAGSPEGPGTNAGTGPFGFDNQQLEFLDADLASVDRRVTPWVIAAGHRPWYSTGGSDNICTDCQKAFESTLYKYGVDVAIFGHVHNSQLFRPVYNNTADSAGYTNPKAPLYIVSGGSGNIEGLSSVGDRQSYNDYAYADDFSYAQLEFKSETDFQVNFIRSATGQTLFAQTLHKDHAEPFVRQ